MKRRRKKKPLYTQQTTSKSDESKHSQKKEQKRTRKRRNRIKITNAGPLGMILSLIYSLGSCPDGPQDKRLVIGEGGNEGCGFCCLREERVEEVQEKEK